MKKVITLFTLMSAALFAAAQEISNYHVVLRDKSMTEFSFDNPEAYLSSKAIERRTRQNLPIDSTDLPVCKKYIDEIHSIGVDILAVSKWENFVTVSLDDEKKKSEIEALPFVTSIEKVGETSLEGLDYTLTRDTVINEITTAGTNIYGTAYEQIHISNGDKLHKLGFRGNGITIGVIDGGFHNLDRIEALDNVKILGVKDFVGSSDIYAETSHGLGVLSCMAANKPNYMVGTAPEAGYWLIRSENAHSEQPVEMDYWIAAVEYADSVGVDVINTSLGYNSFDEASADIKMKDLDGKTIAMTRVAARLADKGIVLVCSAGNEGATSWKKITVPADADNVLTVGAIKKDGTLANFSSVGTTADGRIKPDIVAVGSSSDIINAQGSQGHANGTSFASPIMCGMVACLWQACPTLTAKQVINLVRQSGDRADCPDNVYGYGIPNMLKAYYVYKKSGK